jgi:hypothetical protein
MLRFLLCGVKRKNKSLLKTDAKRIIIITLTCLSAMELLKLKNNTFYKFADEGRRGIS